MNEFHPLIEQHARDLLGQRGAGRRARDVASTRRTTRKAVAGGLHRLADRLEGGL